MINILQSAYGTSYHFRAFVHLGMAGLMVSKRTLTLDSFVYSKGKHTFLGRKTLKITWPFMRLIEVKEKVRISDEQARIQSSESDAREEEVLAWKLDVSFNELAIDYCILLYYNCKLRWTCFLVFIFYLYSSIIYIPNTLPWLSSFLVKVYHRTPKFGCIQI